MDGDVIWFDDGHESVYAWPRKFGWITQVWLCTTRYVPSTGGLEYGWRVRLL